MRMAFFVSVVYVVNKVRVRNAVLEAENRHAGVTALERPFSRGGSSGPPARIALATADCPSDPAYPKELSGLFLPG
jgi:hypothetical protein